jgi:hypothetical protein
MGNGGIVSPQTCRKITDAEFPFGGIEQSIHYLQTRRVCQDGKQGSYFARGLYAQKLSAHGKRVLRVDAALLAHICQRASLWHRCRRLLTGHLVDTSYL